MRMTVCLGSTPFEHPLRHKPPRPNSNYKSLPWLRRLSTRQHYSAAVNFCIETLVLQLFNSLFPYLRVSK